ncbi:MAG: hypothetical protein HQ557_01895 [Bacteroidetes bacterium]|nr:hypothetical protein [Bacteroidota bacterium]
MQKMHIDRYTLYGLTAVLLWSMSVALVRSISEKIGPFTSGAIIYVVGGLFLGSLLFKPKTFAKEIRNLPRLYLFGCGSLFVIYNCAYYLALGIADTNLQAMEVGELCTCGDIP